MASPRRAARAGLNRPPTPDSGPPEWLWGFQSNHWFMRPKDGDEHKSLQAFIGARREWRESCREWLDERGLVLWGISSISWHDYQRIEREEPHRILRRPEPPAG
ncbi:hypothetical protein ACWEQP_09230 [Streptomyces sp. NPDC004044]